MLPFQKVSFDLLPQIKEALKDDKPGSIVPLQMVDMYVKSKQVLKDLEVNLYTPGGFVDKYGTFLLYVPEHRGNFQVYSSNPDYEEIKLGVLNLADIKWNEILSMGPIDKKYHDMFHEIYKEKGLVQNNCQISENLAMTIETALKLNICVPDGVELRELNDSYAQLINSRWPHGGPKSLNYIEETLRINGGMGLFLKGSNEIVSWGVYCMIGGVGMIQTLENHRGKGYGSVIGQAITKVVAQHGFEPNLQINIGLTASKKLFTRMGYTVTHQVTWHLFNK